MTDRPIIFSAPLILAFLAGAKTQIRRVLRDAPGADWHCDPSPNGLRWVADGGAPSRDVRLPWRVGDRLWVREAWRTFVSLDAMKPADLWPRDGKGAGVAYEAGGGMSISADGESRFDLSPEPRADANAFGKLRSPIYMPRWASRITLTVTEVRVQKVRDISSADAEAEGLFERGAIGDDPAADS